MYATLYDEFFQQARNVDHTMVDPREIARQVRIVTRFLPKRGRYLRDRCRNMPSGFTGCIVG